MGRGPLSKEVKAERALAKAQEWLKNVSGGTIEVDPEVLKEPEESAEDKFREAESVLIYFRTGGAQFKERQCRSCGEIFKYRWNVDSISCCSIDCYKAEFKKLNLRWDPLRDQSRRWGSFAPVVVPPAVLKLIESGDVPLEDLPQNMLA